MNWTVETTVATVVCQDDRYLMVEEWSRGKACLNQPSGHVEPYEDFVSAAKRETLEETGWTVDVTHLLQLDWTHQPEEERSFLRITFLAEPLTYDPDSPLDDGIIRAVWMDHSAIQTKHSCWRTPAIGTSLSAYQAGKRWPIDILCMHAVHPTGSS